MFVIAGLALARILMQMAWWRGAARVRAHAHGHPDARFPLGVYESHRHVLEGLAAMRQFVIDSIGQLSQGLRNKAYNAEMLQVLDSCDDCFDWGFLCFQRPLKRHADAFRNVVGMLKPFLQHSLWPPASASDYVLVKRTWDLPETILLLQYGWLCERVRCTASLSIPASGLERNL